MGQPEEAEVREGADAADSRRDGPLMLFYTSHFGRPPATDHLKANTAAIWSCNRRDLRLADVVIFHIPDFPARRRVRKYPGQIWVAWSLESSANYPRLSDPAFMRQFDLTLTYKQGADIWAPYLPRPYQWERITAAPVAARREEAAVVMFMSAGNDLSGRQKLAEELFRYTRIDSYGRLFNNRTVAPPDLGRATKIETVRHYPFCLAFENAIDPDYVTEKMFDPLLAGSIPVYLGAPNAADFVPEGSYIDAAAYGGWRELGTYLNYLADRPEAMARYHEWRTRPLPAALMARSRSVEREAFERLLELCVARLGKAPLRRHRGILGRLHDATGSWLDGH